MAAPLIDTSAWISIGLQKLNYISRLLNKSVLLGLLCAATRPVREQVRNPMEPNRSALTAEGAVHATGKDLEGAIASQTCDTITFLKQDLSGNSFLDCPLWLRHF